MSDNLSNPRTQETLELSRLRGVCERLAHLGGASLPPQWPQKPQEMLFLLEHLVGFSERKLGRVNHANATRDEVGRLEKLKADFLHKVTHELRTPLASIEGFARLLSLESDRAATGGEEEFAPETQRVFLNLIGQESHRLAELIDNLLELSFLEDNPAQGPPALFEAREVLLEAVLSFRARWGEARAAAVQIELHPSPDGPALFARRAGVRDILRHLLDNAQKFSGGQPIVLGAAPVGAPGNGSALRQTRLWVRDRGPGIAREELPNLFVRFHRAEGARNLPGAGLGLAIVQTLAVQSGGSVSVESELEHGSTFSVVLPSQARESVRGLSA